MKKLFALAVSSALMASCVTTDTQGPEADTEDAAPEPESTMPAVQELAPEERAKLAEKFLDNILASVKNNDYRSYVKDSAQEHMDKVTEKNFKERNVKLAEQCGGYVGREYLGCLHKQLFDIYLWKAKFSKLPDDDLLLRLFVINDGGTYKVYAFNIQPF